MLTGGLLVILCIIAILFWCWSSSTETLAFQESLYFQVEDIDGKKSTIHDSGQDPTLRELRLQILKREINNRRATILATPRQIYLGSHPERLNDTIQVSPKDFQDMGDYYIVRVSR